MTFAERVQRVIAFGPGTGFTEAQATFLVIVALHGGYCLRRQYATFTGRRYGHNVRDFLDRLVDRELARRMAFRRNRGYIYHLCFRPLFHAIGEEHNRNRRAAAPALIARKLMLLDFVLSERSHDWYATEADKVELFTNRFGIAADALPQRTYLPKARARAPAVRTTRYFVQKLPIFLAGDPPSLNFVCLVTDRKASEVETFISDHARLLAHLDDWRLVAVGPKAVVDHTACEAAFQRGAGLIGTFPGLSTAAMEEYFRTRSAVEGQQFAQLSVDQLRRFRDCHARWGDTLSRQFADWKDFGAIGLARPGVPRRAANQGMLTIHVLPHDYSQFGSLPGIV
jgi:hypothetical protein